MDAQVMSLCLSPILAPALTNIITVCRWCKHIAKDGNGYWHLVKCPARLEALADGREDAELVYDRDNAIP